MRRVLPLIALGLAVLVGCKTPEDENDPKQPVGSFALTERNGDTVTEKTLEGKVWIASFVFTRCTGPCPQVTRTMAELQTKLADQPDVRLVTITVDPEHDREKVLRQYADAFGADARRWLFLTGSKEDVHRLMLEGFHVGVAENEGDERKPGDEFTHSTKLVLIDRQGRIRGYYSGVAADVGDHDEAERQFKADQDKLLKKVAAVVKER